MSDVPECGVRRVLVLTKSHERFQFRGDIPRRSGASGFLLAFLECSKDFLRQRGRVRRFGERKTIPPRREDGRGIPWKDSREVINGILSIQ
jgi:hypothetical protein